MSSVLTAAALVLLPCARAAAQTEAGDSVHVYLLGDVVVRAHAPGLDLEGFMQQVKTDTSFLHAFLNMRQWPHRVESGLTVRNKGERETAALYRRGQLLRQGPLADLAVDSASERGKLRDGKGGMRYLTAELYEDLFWPKGTWKADNTIAAYRSGRRGHGKVERYKDELKQFMFNPGQEIAGVPFIGDKLDLFDPGMAPLYDFAISAASRNGHGCWLFEATAKDSVDGKEADEDDTVIKRMRTWFDRSTMQVVAREYRISHASLVLDFDITIAVDNVVQGGELLPVFIRYDGDWDIPLHKREIVSFWLRLWDWSVG